MRAAGAIIAPMNQPAAILLASGSPRRRRLIELLGLAVELTVTDADEDLSLPLDPEDLACALAAAKAIEARSARGELLVLAFDTIVVLDGRVLGKPADLDDAWRMLESLSGRTHDVITGVALLEPGEEVPRTFPVTTPVLMRRLTGDAIEAWAATEELLGCAGAYNIEHHLAHVGPGECFQNVAGLPLCHLYRELAREDVRGVPVGLRPPLAACDAVLGRTCALGPVLCTPHTIGTD